MPVFAVSTVQQTAHVLQIPIPYNVSNSTLNGVKLVVVSNGEAKVYSKKPQLSTPTRIRYTADLEVERQLLEEAREAREVSI